MNDSSMRRTEKWGLSSCIWTACVLSMIIAGHAPAAADCGNGNFTGTYALIEKVIFENHGCTASVCHGAATMGGLDLRPGNSYDSLLQEAHTVPGWKRVYPGRRDLSLLFVNLAAKTSPTEYQAPYRFMPPDPVPALSADQLEAVRKWIESGAPKDGVVAGTADLLDACLPPPDPIAIAPLPPPAPDKGIQFRMPRVDLPPHYENEGCFVTYYDISNDVPDQYKSADKKSFRYKRNETRQDPLSHHLIVSRYAGTAAADDPAWGEFHCRGGAREGESCAPTALRFCGAGLCASDFQQSVLCIGFGPADNNLGLQNSGFTGSQETASEFDFPPSVYRELPLSGVLIWNTHHFNISDKPGKVEAWLNFDYAEPEESLYPAQQIFDATDLFWSKRKSGGSFQHAVREVPAFSTYEWCSVHSLPRGARLYELSSHGHRHLKRWRTFLGAFRCQGGAADGEPCSPLGYDMASPDVCKGSPCVGMEKPRAGDCNYDNHVDVNEMMTAVQIALGQASVNDCTDADSNGDSQVAIDELVHSAAAAEHGMPPAKPRDGTESLLYVSHVYNDPIVRRFGAAPLIFASSDPDQRALTYCGLYDNGFSDPTTVKLKSKSPHPPNPLAPGGPCATATNCTAGKIGSPCQGTSAADRNRSCDSDPEHPGDGLCDACPVVGGVTTEDEMFLLLGGFWVQP